MSAPHDQADNANNSGPSIKPKCPFVKGPLKVEVCKGLDVLGFRPTAHQVTLLCKYLEQLHQWNQVYNLTAVRDLSDMLVQHMFDCLAIVKPLQQQFVASTAVRVLDVGSGAGLPAVVIAIMFPDWHVTAVDSVGKKMAFVQQVAGALGIANLTATHSRVEQLQSEPYDLITSRAFASLSDFVQLTHPHLSLTGVWCAMKGKEPVEEIKQLQAPEVQPRVEVFHVEQLQVPFMDASRCLVWMRKSK